jgi:hypothetical protein
MNGTRDTHNTVTADNGGGVDPREAGAGAVAGLGLFVVLLCSAAVAAGLRRA